MEDDFEHGKQKGKLRCDEVKNVYKIFERQIIIYIYFLMF